MENNTMYLCRLSLETRDLLMAMCSNAIIAQEKRADPDPDEIMLYELALNELRLGTEEAR